MISDLIGVLIVVLGAAYALFVGACVYGFVTAERTSGRTAGRTAGSTAGWTQKRTASGSVRRSETVLPGDVEEKRRTVDTAAFVSIIVPARNEQESIVQCVSALLDNDYPHGSYEIIVVDDQSTDATVANVRDTFSNEIAAGRIAIVATAPATDGMLPGKQHALDTGIRASRGATILTTDADCTVGPGWIRALRHAIAETGSAAAGPVRCRLGQRPSLFHRFQALELSGLLGVGAGTMSLGHPTICSSASLAYTRALYDQWRAANTQNTSRLVAGADETIVHVAKELTGHSPRFVLDPEAVVDADPNDRVLTFLLQRARWASMGGRYPAPRVVAVSASIFLFFLLFIVAPLMGILIPWAIALLLKTAADGCLLFVSARLLHPDRRLLPFWPLAEVFHAPYIVFVSIIGTLAPLRWKR